MQDQYFEINRLKELLEKILRVFSFAHTETFDIEIITSNEIDEIWYYLKQHYPKNALWSIGHMTELTLICKAGLLILDDMVILAIKIPIFEQSVCNLKFVYPIPNNESKIVISPSKFYCNELWYNSCNEIVNMLAFKIVTMYIHTLTYKNALLTCTRTEEVIYENCFKFDKIRLGGCHIIQSECDVIVNQHRYSLTINNISVSLPTITNFKMTNLTLDLKIKHLEDPSQIQEDLLEPIHLEGLVPQQNVHFIIGISIVLVVISVIICSLTMIMYQWKKQKYLKFIPLKTLQKLVNEDVEKTQDGGEISPH
ncbi:hypothetical protein ABEB36_004609 [Hypothenemus hampei]|uniref:Envelope protein n=1 Tax=Hypothenemus hampei TaxID=57062 RepID=A0ABD1F7K4_HYPHA